jgi:hypothetical protein
MVDRLPRLDRSEVSVAILATPHLHLRQLDHDVFTIALTTMVDVDELTLALPRNDEGGFRGTEGRVACFTNRQRAGVCDGCTNLGTNRPWRARQTHHVGRATMIGTIEPVGAPSEP